MGSFARTTGSASAPSSSSTRRGSSATDGSRKIRRLRRASISSLMRSSRLPAPARRRLTMLDDTIQKTVMTKDDRSLGAPDARVTMLEYGDFECPYCGMARPVLESLVEEAPDTVRHVFRNFPLTNIHPHALMAAEAAEAAGAQGQFWEMHDMLFDHQDALEYENIVAYASALGLDINRFERELRG